MTAGAPFRHIGIAGIGLIGGSVALAVRAAWPHAVITGFDTSPAVRDAARERVVHHAADSLGALVSCDLVVTAAPLAETASLLSALGAMKTGAVVTDVGSTKRAVMAAAAAAGLTRFVGGHPMAGSERSGLPEARADLFAGRPWLLVPPSAVTAESREALDRLTDFVRGLGASAQCIDADEHDRTVAFVSHLPQVIAVALMNAAVESIGGHGLAASGRAFAEMTRLAGSPPEMWRAILADNADFIAEALARFAANLPGREALRDQSWVRETFARADRARLDADIGTRP